MVRFQRQKKSIKKGFYRNKKPFKIEDIDINKILNSEVEPLCLLLPKMTVYVKYFDSSKTMSFIADDKKLLKKHTKIWENISGLIGKIFDSETVYGDKYIKTKIKLYKDNVNRNFQGKKLPKNGYSYKCLSLIVLDSVIKMGKKCYLQTLLEECKYEIAKKKMENFNTDDLSSESDDKSDGKSGSESGSESDNKADE